MLCATAPIQIEGDDASTDVPFAFSSLLAGICGFVMLLADQGRPSRSVGWSQHVFKTPSAYMRDGRYRRDRCACCDLAYKILQVDSQAAKRTISAVEFRWNQLWTILDLRQDRSMLLAYEGPEQES